MPEFIKDLVELRKSQDISLEDIYERTKISISSLQSIEQGNFNDLPTTYVRLFLKAYVTEIGGDSVKALKELAKVLEDQKDLEILVEGHTDTDKMRSNAHPKDNWELSVLRATSVVKIMLGNSNMDPTTISASGRSQFIPIDLENKAKNRRIEVVLIPKLDELFEIINN